MKNRLLALAVAVVAAICAMSAQTAAEVNASVKKMENASTDCNQGAEPFRKFIAKFSTDKDFMESRLKISDAQRSQFADLLTPETFTAKVPFAKDGEEYYQAWGELQRNSAYLDCGYVDSFSDHTFEFKRIGEKWYLAKIVVE